ncbi:LLM class flavin-dependent oxidoreductase [Geodermatophilus sp. URMC 64]
MNLGIYLDMRNPPGWRRDWSRLYGFTLELCEEAERLGLHSVWTSEHHLFPDGYLPQPLTFNAAIAARTKTIRIGTGIIVAPLHSAVEIAEQAAIVDIVSGGRLDLGLGAGYRPSEFELFGADVTKRYSSTDQRVRDIRQIWAEGAVTPPPVQERLPIWLGYLGPQGARRAGLLGEGLLSVNPALLEPYQQGLLEGGHPASAARMSGHLNVFVSNDPERDWPLVGPYHKYQWDSYRELMVEGTDNPPPRPLDLDVARSRGLTMGKGNNQGMGNILVGTPEDAARQLREYMGDAPVETLFIYVSPGGLPEDLTMQHLQVLGGQLAPLLK